VTIADDKAAREAVNRMGYKFNSLSGVPGEFYTNDRLVDLRYVCEEMLQRSGKQ
jgi:hypothetical protein